MNCSFSGNLATNGTGGAGSFGAGNGGVGQGVGGAIYNASATLIVINSTYSGNVASTSDGDVSASTVVTTLADSGPGSLRQAIGNAAARPGADAVTFDPSLSGGVIHLTSTELDVSDTSGPLLITASNLAGGLAITGDGALRGFGIASGSDVTLDRLTVSNCLGDLGGGVSSGGNLQISRCTISGNAAQYVGGVYNYNSGATLIVDSSTFISNSATVLDGGIYSYGPLQIRNSTIVSNRSVSAGGGVRFNNTATFANNLIAGNSSPSQPDIGVQSANSFLATYNLVGDGAGSTLTNGLNGNLVGTTASPIDPRLGPLQNNGGPTLTLAPLPGSPARDAGDPGFDGTSLTDQRGAARVVYGRLDIGAVEAAAGLYTYYPFDNFSATDALGFSSLTYQGDGGAWWNTDHRGQANPPSP
jgi:hypothetical protein